VSASQPILRPKKFETLSLLSLFVRSEIIIEKLLEKTKKALREKVSLKKVSNQNLSHHHIIIIISLSFGFRVREDEEEHFCAVVFA
jgi:hypothetical protein